MAGENVQDWSTTAATNSAADSSIGWAEGQDPSTVNNSARSMMAAVAKWRNLLNGSITTGGSANAQTVSSGHSYSSVPTGLCLRVKIGFTNTASATLNVDGIGAVTIKDQSGNNLAGGELLLNSYCDFRYNGTNWVLLTPTRFPASTFSAGITATTGTLSGALTGTTAAFSGAITGTSATFSGGLSAATLSATTVTGTGMQVGATGITLGDATYYKVLLAGNPQEAFDTNDYTFYDRTNNAFTWFIGGILRAYVDVGGIVSAGTVTATGYITSSDERMKEDLQAFDAGRIVDATEVWNFRWKRAGGRAYGVMAQHAITVFPYAVHVDNDFWGVDYSRYVPILLAEVKALRARVAALEAA